MIELISSDPCKLIKMANEILFPPDEKILPIIPNMSNLFFIINALIFSYFFGYYCELTKL